MGLNLAGGAANAGLTFAFTLLITHALAPADVGVFLQVLGVFLILIVVTQFGAGATIVKTLAELRAVGRSMQLRHATRTALVPVAALSGAAAVGVFLLAAPLAGIVVSDGHREDAATYLRTLAPFIPIGALFAVLLAATRGLGTMVPTAALDSMLKPGLRVVLVACAAALVTLSPVVLGILWALPLALGLLGAIIVFLRLTRRSRVVSSLSGAGQRIAAREYWLFTIPQWLSDVFQLAVLWLDVVLVGALASSEEAGIYGAISRLVTFGSIGLVALVMVIGPQLSALFALNDLPRVRRLYRLSTLWLASVSIPVFMVMGVFAPLLVRIFGEDFSLGSTALRILSAAMMLDVVAGPALLALLMGGRSGLVLLNTSVAFAVNIALNVALIPQLGMNGAAVAWAISLALVNVLAVTQLHRLWRILACDRTFFEVAAVGILCFGFGSLVAVRLGGQHVTTLVVAAVLEAAVYLAVMWRLRERLALESLLEAVRRRTPREQATA